MNFEDYVDIDLEPWRAYRKVKKSYILTCEGEDDLQLPMAQTELRLIDVPDGMEVKSIRIPRWIAEDRGLLESTETVQDASDDTMSRHDWFMLGLTMAFIVRGGDPAAAVWEASKIADKWTEGA